MIHPTRPEVYESVHQLAGAWGVIVRNYGTGDILDSDGVSTRWADSTFSFFNCITFSDPADRERLEESLATSVRYMKSRTQPGFIWLFEDLLSDEARADLPDFIARAGLQTTLTLQGMAADLSERDLTPKPPPELSLVRVETPAQVGAYADINSLAYGMPTESGRDGFGKPELWTNKAFAYLGMVDGEAVSAASTIEVDGRLFLALVATLPGKERRGYGEATVRKALQEGSRATGLTRSVLQATDAGRPVYQRLGYHTTATIHCLSLRGQG
jgi:hypothetical protein